MHLSRPAMGPTQPSRHWVLGLYQGAQWPGFSADHPPPSNTEVKERVGTIHLLPLRAFVACSGVNFLCICYKKRRVHFWKFKVGQALHIDVCTWTAVTVKGAQFDIYTLGSKFTSHSSDWSRILCNKIWRTNKKWLLVHHLTCWQCNALNINPTRKLIWSLISFTCI